LAAEDCVVQSMPDVSPTRWHLAHTTWFFETFVLRKADASYRSPDPQFEYLFNSYYNTVGDQFPRSRRGLLSRPTVAEVWDYRRHVDAALEEWLANASDAQWQQLGPVMQIGLQHEQQHQELMLTDIKHVFSCNPLLPQVWPSEAARVSAAVVPANRHPAHRFIEYAGGIREVGHCETVGGSACFAYDNEGPRHEVLLQPYALARRPVTNREFLAFIEDGGYERSGPWLSEGWATVQSEGWNAPLYWQQRDGQWFQFTLAGLRPLQLDAPVCHVSFFEADAYARWAGARLPTEQEWEAAARECWSDAACRGAFAEDRAIGPQPCGGPPPRGDHPRQMFGDVWEWTASPYVGYPGYRPLEGAIGEYNGKFMCNQMVLRGGSLATPLQHLRPTYRNFFPTDARWQFSGFRLAKCLN
jgi:ergothioneine biosynthesis protein EgtB